MKIILIIFISSIFNFYFSQGSVIGRISSKDSIDFKLCKIGIIGTSKVTKPNEKGEFQLLDLSLKKQEIQCYCSEFKAKKIEIDLTIKNATNIDFILEKLNSELNEVNVLGTIKETNRSESPIITDIYDKKYFTKNPSSSLIDVLDRMNGVRPQVNCNVCGTGDIHLNGLEGAYTLIVLDGVPIVGGLSSVYGLSGIPTFMLERIEITKGPASSLYGSEAVAGVIHAFSKKASRKPALYIQNFTTSHLENNLDLGVNILVGKKSSVLTTGNMYYFQQKIDQNKDNFTDVPLQNRFSIYQKWNFDRKYKRIFNISARYLNEKRWGGEKNWNRNYRGSDSIYAETIDINRAELNIIYQLPLKEKVLFIGHSNFHQQDSYYGKTKFYASQQLQFLQITWDKTIGKSQFLLGSNLKNNFYDDNTFLTQNLDSTAKNKPLITTLPGLFFQNEYKANTKTNLLISSRLDYYKLHGFIFTPRLAFSRKFLKTSHFRIHAGTGFRVVNLFTEEHAALSGSRQIIILEDLKPERSYSINSSYSTNKTLKNDFDLEFDFQIFYTYFTNRIVPDYLTDPNSIIYSNINGYGQSYGLGMDLKLIKINQFSFQIGATLMDVSLYEFGVKNQQLLTENWSGNWTISYNFKKIPFSIDYTGNITGPMKLPLLSELDPRPAKSSTYSIQNIQFTYILNKKSAFFFGIKNILNWTPAKEIPFLIAGANDPFDKNVAYDSQGQILATQSNPFALSFDPAYVYAPNQGIRFFLGFRFSLD